MISIALREPTLLTSQVTRHLQAATLPKKFVLEATIEVEGNTKAFKSRPRVAHSSNRIYPLVTALDRELYEAQIHMLTTTSSGARVLNPLLLLEDASPVSTDTVIYEDSALEGNMIIDQHQYYPRAWSLETKYKLHR